MQEPLWRMKVEKTGSRLEIFPSAVARRISPRSLSISGMVTCVSGSPNLTLNSTTLGLPSESIINPT